MFIFKICCVLICCVCACNPLKIDSHLLITLIILLLINHKTTKNSTIVCLFPLSTFVCVNPMPPFGLTHNREGWPIFTPIVESYVVVIAVIHIYTVAFAVGIRSNRIDINFYQISTATAHSLPKMKCVSRGVFGTHSHLRPDIHFILLFCFFLCEKRSFLISVNLTCEDNQIKKV